MQWPIKTKLGEIIQLAGVVLLGTGVGFEIATNADIGYVYISIGSVIFAIGCKIKGA